MSSPSENSFNAVRLLAALQVAYIHATYHLHLTPTIGYKWIAQFPGVPIFFAVSGYLVFDSLLRHPLREFFTNRAARIYPALIVNIAIIETLLTLAGQSHFGIRDLAFFPAYVATASDELASVWTKGSGGAHTFPGFFKMYPSGVLWTLTVELTFYAVVPLFALMRSRAARAALVAAATVASFAYQQYLGPELAADWPINVFVFPYFWMFGIGMLFRLWRPPASWSIFALPALLGIMLGIASHRGFNWLEWKVAPDPLISIYTALLCLFAVWLGTSPMMKRKWLAENDMSYGIYLYHMLIVTALMNVAPSLWLLLVVLIGSMAAGYVSWHQIERRFMRLARRRALVSRNQNPAQVSGVIDKFAR